MASNKGKDILIDLSSSSPTDNGDEEDSCNDSSSFSSGEECESIHDEEDDIYELDDDVSGEDDFSDDDCIGADYDDNQSLSNRVIHFLQGKRDLQELSLIACKSYLRRRDLRVSGNKDECIRRVQEHWRIKDGKAEVLYPRASFVVNCTGDVCKGDIVLFKQKVYGSFDKVTRKGKLLGKRTIAGRIVKESYGAAKQQHTFTIEVLWSKGIKKLLPLVPLLVKGRNLYRLKTYRQLWKNEGERRNVLAEKHRRGTSARIKRAKRKKTCFSNKGGKSWNVSHCERASHMSYPERGQHFGAEKGDTSSRHSTSNCNNQNFDLKHRATVRKSKDVYTKSFRRPQKIVFQNGNTETHSNHGSFQKRFESPVGPYYRSAPLRLHSSEFLGEISYRGPMVMPPSQNTVFNHRSFHNLYDMQAPQMAHMNSRQFLPIRTAQGQCTNGLLNCSVRGCNEPGSNACAISACWRCCQRVGMVCNVHR
ncbi:unnamed protein product [Amaranthus hypochondriacus]